MMRATLIAITAPLLLAPLASAHHNDSYSFGSQHNPYPATVQSGCETAREERQLAGGLLGAVAGGVIGVALANDNDDDYHRHRRYRDNRGYRNYRGYRGYRGHRHNNNDDEIAGAVIGGVLGAAIGAGIAGSKSDCATVSNRPYDPAYQPTRSPTGPAWEPVSHTNQDLYGGAQQPREIYTPECTNVQRETRLPDGGMVRESVQACRDQNGRWTLSDGAPLY